MAVEYNRTELVWPGKRTEVERVALPFQVVETINVSRATREQAPMDAALAARSGNPHPDGWRNKLIWGDNKYVLASLLEGDPAIGLEPLAGKVDLIYIDPPFDTGDDFSFRLRVGGAELSKEPSIIEERAYRDMWGDGRDLGPYLQMMYERLVLMRELLSDLGCIYIHLDWHLGHYVKILMDEIFGQHNFLNEITWYYYNKLATGFRRFARASDKILFYAKDSGVDYTFRVLEEKRDEPVKQLKRRYHEGRPINVRGPNGKVEYRLRETRRVDDVWRVRCLQPADKTENTGFETQKPEDVISRVLEASTNPGDLVADFFCGSGTTMAVAEKCGRRWIGCDLGRFAIHVSRKRLLDIPGCRPFEVLNLGKYERQHWQGVELGEGPDGQAIQRYLDFIVELYKGESVRGFIHLHGRKAGRMVHVGATDAPVTLAEIKDALEECAANNFRGLDVLGWEWEMGLHDLVTVEARKRGIDLRLLTIPREVMDKRAVEAGDVHFYELAYLDVDIRRQDGAPSTGSGRSFQVVLRNFVIPNEELVPQEVRDKITRWSDYVDFWAVDWDYQGDTFHNQWQSYRTRKHPALRLDSDPHTYDKPGKYQVMVKVIDIFGNDTTKLLSVSMT